jgi:transcriptional regulator with XRE-family HTH domain
LLISLADTDIIKVRKKIGKKIRETREQKGLSLLEIEALSGIGHDRLGKLENGNVNIQIDSLINVITVLKIQPRDLFNFKVVFAAKAWLF